MKFLKRHYKMSDDEATKKSIELLSAVGIPNPEERIKEYPTSIFWRE